MIGQRSAEGSQDKNVTSLVNPDALLRQGWSDRLPLQVLQMLRCSRGRTDFQRWIVRYEIARRNAVDAWLDITAPRPGADHHAEVERLREAARGRLRAEGRQTYIGAPDGLQAHVVAVALPEATAATTETAIETAWRTPCQSE